MTRRDLAIFKKLEQRSDFFCPAKWTELFLYLNHGTSNSCHHPLPHAIPSESLDDPYVLHNTPHKLAMQKMMLDGQRPPECHMCWHIEDSNPDVISDRLLKSKTWESEIDSLEIDPKYIPKFIEVVFDNYCNLSCSYCDSGQSSTWAAKIHQKPLLLKTDHRRLYSKIHIQPGTTKDDYYQAWLKWWPEIGSKVHGLKISGGEPLMSNNFWNFLESTNDGCYSNLDFGINSNLSVPTDKIDKFAAYVGKFKSVTIGASIDATGKIAEFARQGLDYGLFLSNIERWMQSTPDNAKLYLQSTVNILNIWDITGKFDLAIELRKRFPNKVRPFYNTVVRFPEFQSVTLLPQVLRSELADDIKLWKSLNESKLETGESAMVDKLISYLVDSPKRMHDLDEDQLRIDFKKFLIYYDKSSKHHYRDIYPSRFLQWIDRIEIDR